MAPCPKCQKDMTSDSVLRCSLCRLVLHRDCDSGYRMEGLKVSNLSALGFRWFCNHCSPTLETISVQLRDVKSNIVSLLDKVSGIESILSSSNITAIVNSYASVVMEKSMMKIITNIFDFKYIISSVEISK
jgi:hypothetical protein